MHHASPLGTTLLPPPAPDLLARERAYLPETLAPTVDTADLIVAPAVTYAQLRACSRLVRRMYAWRGYRIDCTADHHADDLTRLTLIAWQGGEAVATLTLGIDSPAGLLCEALYPDEVAQLRHAGQIICEVSRLAVDQDHSSRYLLTSLFRVAHAYGRDRFGATGAVIEVNPRHAGYYQREFGFTPVGSLRQCPRVAAPAILLYRPLHANTLPLCSKRAPATVLSIFSSAVGT